MIWDDLGVEIGPRPQSWTQNLELEQCLDTEWVLDTRPGPITLNTHLGPSPQPEIGYKHWTWTCTYL